MAAIELDLISHSTRTGLPYQHLHIYMTQAQIQLEDLQGLELPVPLLKGQGVVLEGRAPLWLYGYLAQKLIEQQVAWIGCYEPRLLSAVVAANLTGEYPAGYVLPLDLPALVVHKSEPPKEVGQWTVVMNAHLELQVTTLKIEEQDCQSLAIDIANRADPAAPVSYINGQLTLSNLMPPGQLTNLKLPAELKTKEEVILFGAGPTWLYVHLLHCCQKAPWVGFYDVQTKQAVVVYSQKSALSVGIGLPLVFNRNPGTAILVGGPPNSGKSVFSNALRCSLLQAIPKSKVYLHRANWDGEGNFVHDMPEHLRDWLVEQNERRLNREKEAGKLITDYFVYHARTTSNIRDLMEIAIVDVGGVAQAEKSPLVEKCTHYIIISSKPERVQEWHDLCSPALKPVAVIHSKLEPCFKVLRTEPFLEIEAGPWKMGMIKSVPDAVLQAVLNLLEAAV
jgi:CRISPR-associated protein Csx3